MTGCVCDGIIGRSWDDYILKVKLLNMIVEATDATLPQAVK